jgi:hypothetical protein
VGIDGLSDDSDDDSNWSKVRGLRSEPMIGWFGTGQGRVLRSVTGFVSKRFFLSLNYSTFDVCMFLAHNDQEFLNQWLIKNESYVILLFDHFCASEQLIRRAIRVLCNIWFINCFDIVFADFAITIHKLAREDFREIRGLFSWSGLPLPPDSPSSIYSSS